MTNQQNGVQLRIENMKKKFGSTEVIKGIDLQVDAGEFVAVVGKSGCGKSTLLRLIAGLEEKTEGTIYQNDAPLSKENDDARVMFQEDRLLPWQDVLTNVGFGLQLQNDWQTGAKQLLQEVGLEDHASKWPSLLSGGQKQRVALARALAANPRLLLFDEPLGALDALTRIEMQGLIEEIWKRNQFTALLVTHDVSEAIMLADRIIVISEGTISYDRDVPLPRPRERSHPVFKEIERELYAELLEESHKQQTFAMQS
ncbi:ATP-binding cassette domain-containing protein [Geomicrobium sediminis]|uniref:Sulfonate transport system ATP-binding protein n=1 Tax=Geomicrobium sediminis TaxID=1347788 RepID=A0ABS2PHE4_9BACL|nr:ATP-binding cassette domain-containing protein [Geomicrobium sediminis]MBM7634854.1 sulfonate transport system ATP-binding protein [Geomicrobium sediminis]